MADWLEFEEQCTQYLNAKFGHKARFSHLGSADSTVPDIHVTTNSGRKFYLDAKMTPAQCGQFVLLPDVSRGCFVFSDKNKTAPTPQVQTIVNHMNSDFEAYKEAGTGGKNIELGDGGRVFAQWIVETYRKKGAEFFITNEYTILPVGDFSKHFDVSATYRVKRSGSANVGTGNLARVSSYVEDRQFPVEKLSREGSKLFAYGSGQLHNRRFVLDGNEYMFSARGDRYEVRKLSNTFHANVIFSINRKKQKGLTDAEFESYLD